MGRLITLMIRDGRIEELGEAGERPGITKQIDEGVRHTGYCFEITNYHL